MSHTLVGAWARLMPGVSRALVESVDGTPATIAATPERIAWLRHKHHTGKGRLGLSPVVRGRCRWGCIDLDAHEPGDPDRLDDAFRLAAGFAAIGLTPYIERSRGGRGYHVWLFFDAPGALAADLHALLVPLAVKIGNADVFPSSPTRHGKMIFLPGFGDAPIFDRDLDLVDVMHVEPDDPNLVDGIAKGSRLRVASGWPPPFYRSVAGPASKHSPGHTPPLKGTSNER